MHAAYRTVHRRFENHCYEWTRLLLSPGRPRTPASRLPEHAAAFVFAVPRSQPRFATMYTCRTYCASLCNGVYGLDGKPHGSGLYFQYKTPTQRFETRVLKCVRPSPARAYARFESQTATSQTPGAPSTKTRHKALTRGQSFKRTRQRETNLFSKKSISEQTKKKLSYTNCYLLCTTHSCRFASYSHFVNFKMVFTRNSYEKNNPLFHRGQHHQKL